MFDFAGLWEKAQDNVTFLLVCLLVFAGLFAMALLLERLWLKPPKQSEARRVAYIGIFSAIAAVLMYVDFPLPFAPAFYTIDFSEVPVLICSFSLGPVAGVVCEFVKILIKLVIKGTSTFFVGEFANFVVGCTLVLPATVVYHRFKSKKGALAGMITGTVIFAAFGSFFNAVYLIPTFAVMFGGLDKIYAMSTAINPAMNSVAAIALMAVVPFNLVKGVVDSILTYLLYKHIERLFRMK